MSADRLIEGGDTYTYPNTFFEPVEGVVYYGIGWLVG